MQQTVTTIQGDRVLLRPFQDGDAEEAARVWTPELRYMYGGSRTAPPPDRSRVAPTQPQEDQDSGRHHFAIEADGRYIGHVALKLKDQEKGSASYRIGIANPEYWGRGYGTEVTRLMLRYAFETLGLHRVHLRVVAYNTRARRCYEKSGFRLEGVLRKSFQVDGEWQDDVLMAILREEWETLVASGTGLPQAGHDDVGARSSGRPGDVLIRSYQPSDYNQASAIWRAEWGDKPADSQEAVTYKLAQSRGLFLVAESAGEVIGTVLASWDGRWAWVSRLAVHSDYRRRGIARLLMAEAEKALTALGAHSISLLVHKEEAAALGLYETLGYTLWEPVGYMSKKLEQPKKEADIGG